MKIRKTEYKDIDKVIEIFDYARNFMRENNNPNQWINGYPSRENVENDIFVDTVSVTKAKKLLNVLPTIHTVKANRYEAEVLSEMKIEDEEDIIAAGKEIVKRGVKRAFLTLGEKGAYYFEGNQVLKVKSNIIAVENATGAGDAFMAGLCYSHFKDLSIEETFYIAVGSSRVTLKDNNTISDSLNLDNIMKERGEIKIC